MSKPKQPNLVPINKSPLYRIGKKADLARILQTTPSELRALQKGENYKEWRKREPGRKDRLIEEPLPRLAAIQQRLHSVIRRIETPPWLMSGRLGVSAIDNALLHHAEAWVINVDIDSFFQSTKREFVIECFKAEFDMVGDVATMLADLVTYKGHIPTGTSTSQDMAYWAYQKLFNRIHAAAAAQDIAMSLWVDDITFSRDIPFPKKWTRDVNKMLTPVDLRLNFAKTKYYAANEHKMITGSAVDPSGGLRVKNSKRTEIRELIGRRSVEELSLSETRSLLGKLAAQRRNESDFFDGIYQRCRAHLKQLLTSTVESRKSLILNGSHFRLGTTSGISSGPSRASPALRRVGTG